MAQSYEELITDTCSILSFAEPQRLLAGEPIYLNDVMFTLIHDARIDENRIFLFALFGGLPDANRESVLEKLLQENHASFSGGGPGFSISPVTGKVSYALHIKMDKISPMNLAKIMAYLCRKATEWRSTFFLDEAAISASTATSTKNRISFSHPRA